MHSCYAYAVSPSWTQEPQDVNVREGDNVTVTCIASGRPSPAIKWKRKGVQNSAENFPGSSLKLSKANKSVSGTYTCTADNGLPGVLEKDIRVNVFVQWLVEPQDVSVKEAENVTISCEATGIPKPNIRWEKEGIALSASGPKLHLSKASKADSGTYKCTADNGLREPLAKEIRVSVYEFKLQPFRFPTDAVEGKTVTVTCTTTTAISGVEYRWFKNNKPISESPKLRLRTFPELSALIVGPLEEADSGNYTCRGVYNGKKDSFSDELRVQVPPSWTQAPEDTVRVMEGANLTIPCRAKGKPEPTVTVMKEAPPKWTIEPTDVKLHQGGNVTVPCGATGNPTPTIRWKLISKRGDTKDTKASGTSQLHIMNASKLDAGSYECSADNEVPDAIAKTIVIAIYVNLQVKSQGKGSATLQIAKSTKADAGAYSCTASNGFGVDIHENFFVKIYGSISVVPFYVPDKVMLGDTVKIVCYTSTEQAPLTFKWLKDGTEVTGDEFILIKTQADLSTIILGPVKPFHAGNYTCQVSAGTTSSGSHTASLVIYAPPSWLLEPSDQRVARGSNVTIHCKAFGQPAPQTRWIFLGGSTTTRSLNTETDGSLHLINIQKPDQGSYSCTASNGVGNPLEKTISLTKMQCVPTCMLFRLSVRVRATMKLHICFAVVLHQSLQSVYSAEPPDIQPMVFPKNLKEGARFRAFCSATGSPPFTFKWRKNNQELREDETVLTENAQDYSILVIRKLGKGHAGNYTCIAKNSGGATRHTAELIVNAPPAWTVEPSSGAVLLGDNLDIGCQSYGYPEPTVTWQKRNSFCANGIAGPRTPSAVVNGTLRIRNATKADGGKYVCTAANSYGERIEKEVTVRVSVPARFEEKFKVQTVRRGEGATLQCQALGDSPLEITWSQDKKRLMFAPVTRYEKFESNTENGVTSELVIPTTDRSDAALYTCLAKNEYGSDERNIKLLVVEVPAQPLDLRILEVWSRKVNVIWSEPYSGNSLITNYIVHYWRDRGEFPTTLLANCREKGAHRLLEQTVPSGQTSTTIGELHPGSSYSLTVTAENEVGQGPPSDPVRLPGPPRKVSGPASLHRPTAHAICISRSRRNRKQLSAATTTHSVSGNVLTNAADQLTAGPNLAFLWAVGSTVAKTQLDRISFCFEEI
ncbi:hypothetical protein HPB48_021078 [Haemaphysalis longicornis]|uniref:Uncharacterized protein n=1 Tax=Haemaphysalis longicornis TaxID=44386 RepID=A0A9J6H2M7_HAELO|nr:hypothetical protein HPB48_021078 [Haemaphysalis longicornis]